MPHPFNPLLLLPHPPSLEEDLAPPPTPFKHPFELWWGGYSRTRYIRKLKIAVNIIQTPKRIK